MAAAVIAAQRFLLLTLAEPLPLDHLRQTAGHISDWQSILALASCHDVIPQLHQALQQLGTVVPLPMREKLRVLYANEALRALQLDGERHRVTALLLAAGIPVIPWKGPVLAVQLYGDVTMRSSADLDLLVPPEQARQALVLLKSDGYSPGFDIPEPRWLALRRVVNHLTLEKPAHSWLVEIHWGLFHPMHVFPVDLSHHWRALRANESVCEGGLPIEEMLVLLCAHGTVHRWEKLKWVADIARLVKRYPDLDWNLALRFATRMGSRRCLLLGLKLAGGLSDLVLPKEIVGLLGKDGAVARLAGETQGRWFSAQTARQGAIDEYLYHLRSRERVRDRLIWVFRQSFAPRQADWQIFAAGSSCFALFYLERPLRMVWKWMVRPQLARLRNG